MADGILNTRVDIFCSRFLHMLSTGLLVGTAAVPLLYKNAEATFPKFFMIAAGIAALTGLYNAHILQPARMREAATLYRLIVYVGKILLLILTSPVLDRFLKGSDVHTARFAVVVLAVALGTWSRYYREKYSLPKPSADVKQ